VDVKTWLEEHRVVQPKQAPDDCHTVPKIGVPPQEGLVCIAHLLDPLGLWDGRELVIGSFYAVQKGQLREVLRAAVGSGAMHDEGGCAGCGQRFYVRLIFNVTPDGRCLTLVEDPERPCAMTAERLSRIRDVGPKFVEQQRQLDARACAARGLYCWQNGRYVRRYGGRKPASGSSGP
jgi:hypothetical protein